MNRRVFGGLAAALLLGFWQKAALGALGASATLTSQQLGPTSYEYDITLTDTGTTPIGTFWFGWIPGYDLLPSAPTSVSSPSGWTGVPMHEGIGVDSVQWVNATTPLQPGQSLSGFTFDSPDTPAAISHVSSFFGEPVEESYVYIGAPETDPGFALRATTVVPEPASLVLLAGPATLLLRRKRR